MIFAWMVFWLAFGLVLEFLIGTRNVAYLDVPYRRELWRLAHAHGLLMGLVLVVFEGQWGFARAGHRRLAVGGVVLMPLGFLLGGLWSTASDPFVGVLLAPVGGLAFVLGLAAALIAGNGKRMDDGVHGNSSSAK
jgi:hypothetical protein